MELLGTGVIVLDASLQVKRFSRLVERLFALEPHDINRKLSVIGPRFDFIDLPQAAKDVLEGRASVSASGLHDGRRITIDVQGALAENGSASLGGVFVIIRPQT